jgi:hypothetical protein
MSINHTATISIKYTTTRPKWYCKPASSEQVDSGWNVMAHGDAREGKCKGNWRMDWEASTLHTTSEHGVSSITTLMRTPRLPVVEWTDAPADLNGLVHFAERRSLVSVRVPSHFNCPLIRSKHTGVNFKTGCILRDFCDLISTTNICMKVGRKVGVQGVDFHNCRTYTDCDSIRGIRRRMNIICFQRWSKILAAINLTIKANWEQLRQDGWKHTSRISTNKQ